MEVETSPGVYLSRRGFEPVLEGVSGTVIQLHEGRDPVVEIEPPEKPVFVLSDHRDFTEPEVELLAENSDEQVRLGPERLHANHAITVAHNWLDTEGFVRY